MEPNFVAIVDFLLPTYGQICQGIPYLCIFALELVPLLGTLTDKWV